ncbi:hypothetical protein EJ05DRAFT_509779 [Pseudovirgaria hyperparasitica]|uniref:AhpC-TSA-domain-containing protein n=1 Tax=Pseudovirgaria hyperparasitica TaxID=470096 RepID=A0A6A6W9Q3_9PEZI|nr:uncharacterized protein EJ05DRAFT_509779 [Pseudovirgaria hyperparasitica]KAF2758889.1 hypothetical protein EJ05DRAFT_509779 [Pseudovirgaria hyperparasitica]
MASEPVATPGAPQENVAPEKSDVSKPDDTQGEFKGDLNVSTALPTEEDLKKCEDLVVLDNKGSSRTFKSLYTADNTAPRQLIIFVRHFFCGNCQEYLRTLCSSITPEDLISLEKPTFITVIGCGKPELIDMYVETTGCPFPVYADPSTKLYDALGMVRTLDLGPKKPEYIQSGMLGGALRSILQGLKSGKNAINGGSFKQVGGEFMFEHGKATWCHRMRNTRDHAGIPEIKGILGLDGTAKPPPKKTWGSGLKDFARRGSSLGRPAKEGEEGNSSESKTKSMTGAKEETQGSALKQSSAAEELTPVETTPAVVHGEPASEAPKTETEVRSAADVDVEHPVGGEQVDATGEASKVEQAPAAKA